MYSEYENIPTDKLVQLKKASLESFKQLTEEIETGSYSFDELDRLTTNQKIAQKNYHKLSTEINLRSI